MSAESPCFCTPLPAWDETPGGFRDTPGRHTSGAPRGMRQCQGDGVWFKFPRPCGCHQFFYNNKNSTCSRSMSRPKGRVALAVAAAARGNAPMLTRTVRRKNTERTESPASRPFQRRAGCLARALVAEPAVALQVKRIAKCCYSDSDCLQCLAVVTVS